MEAQQSWESKGMLQENRCSPFTSSLRCTWSGYSKSVEIKHCCLETERERERMWELWMVFIVISLQTSGKRLDPADHQKWNNNVPSSGKFTISYPHVPHLFGKPSRRLLPFMASGFYQYWHLPDVSRFDSIPPLPHLPPLSHAANELAWKQLFSGNMTYNSSKMHLAQMNSSRICL